MIKICECCGKEFETSRKDKKWCNDDHYNVCQNCGKSFKVTNKTRNAKTCSKECMKELMSMILKSDEVRAKTEQTNLKKYGTRTPAENEDIKKRTIEINREKYGVDYPSTLSVTQDKRIATTKEKYGVENVLQSEDIKQKIKATNLKKYGYENPSSSPKIKEKVRQTNIKNLGVDNPLKSTQVRKKLKETNRQRYGVDYPIQSEKIKAKTKATNQKNFGVDWPVESTEVRKKINETNIDKYGTVHPVQNDIVKAKMHKTVDERYGGYTYQSDVLMEKVKATNLKKYGTEYASQSDIIKNKVQQTSQHKYGTDSVFQSEEVKAKISQSVLARYGVPWNCMRPEARNYKTISKVNLAFADLLDSNSIEYELEFPIENRSYDFYISSKNILIEIDPTITHNTYMNIFEVESKGIDKNYHLDKTKLAQDYGYRCIHIFDWEDWNKVMYLLLPEDSIYARKCIIGEINNKQAGVFEDVNHIQGKCNGQRVCLGLYYEGDLVEIMSWGKPRYSQKYEWELLRLCSLHDKVVIGGASKLFQYFIRKYKPQSIISYCDIAKFSGEVYEKMGMTLDHTTPPNKIWSRDTYHITNNILLKFGYDILFKTSYGKGADNEELMLNGGWLPVYDCGQSVYVWKNS